MKVKSINGEQPYEDYPSDLYLMIAQHCDDPNSLLALRQVSKIAYQGTKQSSRYAFFNTHSYVTFLPELRYYLLNTKNMTALNVYMGNLMVKNAISLYLAGDFMDSYARFVDAMCEHGSSNALLILVKFFNFSTNVELKLNHIIEKHRQHEKTIASKVTDEDRKAFNIPLDVPVTPYLTNYIHCFYKTVKRFYLKDKDISYDNISKLKKKYDESVSTCDWADLAYDGSW